MVKHSKEKKLIKTLKSGIIILLVGLIAVFGACSGKRGNASRTAASKGIAFTQNDVEHMGMIGNMDDFNSVSEPEPSDVNLNKYLNFEPMYTLSNIKIWGWSNDGRIAYSCKKFIDSRGGSITTAFILNSIDDVILWEDSLDSFNYDEEDYEENEIYKAAYVNFIDNFRNKCVQNGIEFLQTDFLNLPVRHDNQTVNITIEKKEKSDDGWDEDMTLLFGNIGSYKITAEDRKKEKTIYEKFFRMAAVDVVICGYFISPFENIALIAIGEYIRVLEGYDIEYTFIGCHLSDGFR